MSALRRFARWYGRARLGYLAPSSSEPVRCTRGRSVLFGTVYADHGAFVQVLVEGHTLVALHRGAWKVEPA